MNSAFFEKVAPGEMSSRRIKSGALLQLELIVNCSSVLPVRQPAADSRNVAQWQSREHGGRGRPDTGSSPVVPIWSMCVNGPEGCGTQLNSRQAGTVQIVMTEITRNLTGIRDSPERRELYGTLMEALCQDKPL